jgi:PPOX class probable F420-dependent enzyme
MEPAHLTSTAARGLTSRIRAFLAQPLFATLATIDPDGAPRQAVIWYRLEDDGRIMINSRIGRRWPSNLLRDGRVSLAIKGTDGYTWVGLTGGVDEVVKGPQATEDILALDHRYHPEGSDPEDLTSFRQYPRISFLIAIDGVHEHLED